MIDKERALPQSGPSAGEQLWTTNTPTAALTAAERMRLHRERRRQGLRCLMIELRETEIDVLVAKGLLSSETRDDPRVVCEALYAHLDQTLGSTPWRETAR